MDKLPTRYDEMREAVQKFHEAHPEVWDLFHKFTMDRINNGFKHYSAKAIFERIRWETDTGADGKNEFKIGNNFTAFYAREWMEEFPQYKGFFRLREQKSKSKPSTGKPEQTPKDYNYE